MGTGVQMKYIRTQDFGIVVFGNHITHEQMARKIIGQNPNDELISAGFITGVLDEINFYGESVSLNLKSLGYEDERKWKIQLSI